MTQITLSEEGKKLVAELDEELNQEDLTETQKAMVVAMSRRIAADLYKEIIKIRPGWHSGDLKQGKIKVVMTSASSDGPEIARHHTTKDQRRVLADRMMLEKLEVVSQMFHGFASEDYYGSDTGAKLSLILSAEEHILGLENGRKRYINEVTSLSQAFAIAIPHEEALDVKDEVAFFQAVKSRLVKFERTGAGKTDEEVETAIRQVIDKALVSEQVIEVLIALGRDIREGDEIDIAPETLYANATGSGLPAWMESWLSLPLRFLGGSGRVVGPYTLAPDGSVIHQF